MLSSEQRRSQADKLGDAASNIVTALLLGQFLSHTFSLELTVVGIAVSGLCFFYGNRLLKIAIDFNTMLSLTFCSPALL